MEAIFRHNHPDQSDLHDVFMNNPAKPTVLWFYQEDVIKIVCITCRASRCRRDILRRAMSAKDVEAALQKVKDNYLCAKGHSVKLSEEIYRQIEPLPVSFCKAHPLPMRGRKLPKSI
jgi:DNA polymerase III alpha subunit